VNVKLRLSLVSAVLSLVHSGVEVDKMSPSTFRRPCSACHRQKVDGDFLSTSTLTSEWTSHTLALFRRHSALYAVHAKKIWLITKK